MRRPTTLLLVPVTLALAACTGTPATTVSRTTDGSASRAAAQAPGTASRAPSHPAPGPASGLVEAPAGTPETAPPRTPSPSKAPSPVPARTCAALVSRLTPEQRVGQLLMVGLDGGQARTQNDERIARHKVGNVIYLGGWDGARRVSRTSAHLQTLATDGTTGGIPMLVAADQEGGTVRQLRGGFTALPRAVEQGRLSPAQITGLARRLGTELKDVGVNLDLAPVADTVPPQVGRANDPIGRWGRQFGDDPATAARGVSAFTTGLRQAGVGATVKHFPGLGRVRGNTDFTAHDIDDAVATARDPHLGPFEAGIAQGAAVMVSSARYPRLDPDNQAVFSHRIVTGLLRGRLGYRGLVMTDDMGSAVAVATVSPADRALRFVDAGGDLVLTGRPSDIAPMSAALLGRRAKDTTFARRIDESATRVVAYKAGLGLVSCR